MLPREVVDDRRHEPGHQWAGASHPQFPRSRVRKELYSFDALTQFVEDGHAAIDDLTAIYGRLDTIRSAVEETHAQRMLKFADRLRNHRVRYRELYRCLGHAPGLRDGKQNMEVPQLDATADTVCPIHGRSLSHSSTAMFDN